MLIDAEPAILRADLHKVLAHCKRLLPGEDPIHVLVTRPQVGEAYSVFLVTFGSSQLRSGKFEFQGQFVSFRVALHRSPPQTGHYDCKLFGNETL